MRALPIFLLLAANASAQEILSGQVRDMRHEPLPVAQVWIESERHPGRVLARTVADGEGRFRVSLTPNGDDLRVWAKADGYSTNAVRCGVSNRTATVRLQRGATLTGVLTSKDGEPFANATVRASSMHPLLQGAVCSTTTDARGHFALLDAPLAKLEVFALTPAGVSHATVQVTGNQQIELRNIGPPTSLRIAVDGVAREDEDSVRIDLQSVYGGGLVLPAPLDRPRLHDGEWRTALLPEWSFSVQASAPGYRFQPSAVSVPKGRGARVAELHARPLPTTPWRARVTDATGQAIPNLPLLLRGPNGRTATLTSDEHGEVRAEVPFARGNTVLVSTLSDEWIFDNAKERSRTVPSIYSIRSVRRKLIVDQVTNLQVIRAAKVTGRIMRRNGRPAAFAQVTLRTPYGRWKSVLRDVETTRTDPSGRFSFGGLPHGPCDLFIVTTGVPGSLTSEAFQIAKPSETKALDPLTITPSATIEGVLTDIDGTPLPGEYLHASWVDPKGELPHGSQGTFTDEQGRFRFVGVIAGIAIVQARDEQLTEVTVNAGETNVLDISVK